MLIVPAEHRKYPLIVQFIMAGEFIVPPLFHKPVVAGTMAAAVLRKGAIVEALESLNVPLTSDKPPEGMVIIHCASITEALLVPLFTTIPPLKAVEAAVPLMVF